MNDHLLVVVGDIVVVVVVVVVSACPLYSSCGKTNLGGGSWNCQLPTIASTCQAGGQASVVAQHPRAAAEMVEVAVEDVRHLPLGRVGLPEPSATGDRSWEARAHRLRLLEVGA